MVVTRVADGQWHLLDDDLVVGRGHAARRPDGRLFISIDTWHDTAFDQLCDDGDTLRIGDLPCEVLYLPGHTPDHIGYLIGENVFVGDSIFNPDVGSARCDFPG